MSNGEETPIPEEGAPAPEGEVPTGETPVPADEIPGGTTPPPVPAPDGTLADEMGWREKYAAATDPAEKRRLLTERKTFIEGKGATRGGGDKGVSRGQQKSLDFITAELAKLPPA